MTLRPKGPKGQALKFLHEIDSGNCPCELCAEKRKSAVDAERAAGDAVIAERRAMKRVNWIPAPHFFNLNQACVIINEAFEGFGCYLVGSATERRDYRDVDVRYIMDDAVFERFFPGSWDRPDLNPFWSLLCSSISLFLQTHTGLPVDFQIQAQSIANAEFSRKNGHDRQPLGIFRSPTPRDYAASMASDAKE